MTEEQYLQKFNSFLTTAELSSTYKPVFLKSIVDLADFDPLNPSSSIIGAQWLKPESQGKLSMELDFVAVRYAKYYWDMLHRYRLQQSHNPTDVNIHKIFPEIANPPTLEVLATDRYARLRKEVISRSIRPQVLKFLNNDMHLYEIIPRKNYIVFDTSICSFLRKYRQVLTPAINFTITRYLEKINFSHRIAEKVHGRISRDYPTLKEKAFLLSIHDSCFYCGRKEATYEYDHVIPFGYIFHTSIFNIVCACKKCNSRKSNKLPTADLFKKVIHRNIEKNILTPKDYSPEWYQNLYDKCIVEYHGQREFFEPEMST